MEFDENVHGEPFPKPGRFLGDRSIAREPDPATVQKAQTLAEKSDNPNLTAAKLLDPYRLDHSLPIDHLAEAEQPQYIFLGAHDSSIFLVSDKQVMNIDGAESLQEYADPDELSKEELEERLEEAKDKDLVQAIDFQDLTEFVAKSGITSLKFKYKIKGDSGQKSYSANPNYHDEEELLAAEDFVGRKMSTGGSARTIKEVVENAESSTVTVDRLKEHDRAIWNLLYDNEQVHYILEGNPLYGIKIEGGETTDDQSAGLFSIGKTIAIESVYTVITDQRVILLVLKKAGKKNTHIIDLSEITGVDSKESIKGRPIIIQTHGRTYYADTRHDIHKGENIPEEPAQFLNRLAKASSNSDAKGDSQKEGSSAEVGPLEQLEKLAQLKDDGVISEEEFLEKKSNLLERL